jgi:hypothetical protein
MTWLKIAGVALGVFIAFAVVSTVLGYLIWIGIAALVVGAIVLAVKAARHKGKVSSAKAEREVSQPAYASPLPRPQKPNVDDELAKLKRDMGH